MINYSNAKGLHCGAVYFRDLYMRLLVAFLILAGVSVGALGYFAFNGQTQSGKRTNLIGIYGSSENMPISTGSCCKKKCCDEELDNENPT